MKARKLDRNPQFLFWGAVVGLLYGVLYRFFDRHFPNTQFFAVMTLGFVFLVPLAMGFVSVYIVERHEPHRVGFWMWFPWVPLISGVAISMLLLWEGAICVVMFLPIGIILASLGGLLGGALARTRTSRSSQNIIVGCVLMLPMLVTPLEQRLFMHNEVRHVETSVAIHASPEVVWRNIERVREIHPTELPQSWTNRIGFPAPVEATLSFEGVGGVRHATFAGGVLFIETVDVWELDRRLAFSIHAQTDQIPANTLDEHVRVGGQFFDVLRGEYAIEPLADGTVVLHLSSDHRLSTDFNWYAQLWTDATMRDIQSSILKVIQNRCERPM
jgi:hypothetical protein